ncbi:MAG: PAS domain S-box protein [Desulfobacterales bacterium]|nr:PAS domain S-box protein [Desulfobacterales bacterium]
MQNNLLKNSAKGKHNILIVDDDQVMIDIFKIFFKRLNYDYKTALNGVEAMELINLHHFDIVIADINMPKMSGIELVKTALKSFPDLNFIMMTGGDKYSFNDIIAIGAKDYIIKPIRLNELESRIYKLDREMEILSQLNITQEHLKKSLEQFKIISAKAQQKHLELNQIVNQMFEALRVIDLDFNIININTAYLNFIDESERDVMGNKCYNIFPCLKCHTDECALFQIMHGKKDIQYELTKKCADGSERLYFVMSSPLKDDNDNVKGIITTYRDVTIIKKIIKQEAMAKEAFIREKISKSFLMVSDELVYTEVLNLILKEMQSKYGVFGYIDNTGDLVSPTLTRDVWTQCEVPEKNIIFPKKSWTGIWGRSLIEQVSLISNQPIRVPDGHVPMLRVLTVPIIYDLKTIGLFMVANKKTDYDNDDMLWLESIANYIAPILHARLQKNLQENERRQIEKALKESEERYRTSNRYMENILKSMLDVLIVTDSNGKITMVNRAALEFLEYAENELIGMDVFNIWENNDDTDNFKEFVNKLKENKLVKNYDMSYRTKSGEKIPVNFSGSVILDIKNQIFAIVTIARDMRELKNMMVQLIQSEKMIALGELTAGVAHELSQPLNVIKIISQMLIRNLKKNQLNTESFMQDTDEIILQVGKMAMLIDHMRSFTRISPEGVKANININQLIQLSLRFLTQQLNNHNIELNLNLEPNSFEIMGDPIRLEQVLLNLLTNARYAVEKNKKENKTIEIRTYPIDAEQSPIKKDSFAISVKDNGVGIPDKILNKIFDQFFTTKEPGKGTGLGLSISRKIIEDHNGIIEVESEIEQGSVFRIILPKEHSCR